MRVDYKAKVFFFFYPHSTTPAINNSKNVFTDDLRIFVFLFRNVRHAVQINERDKKKGIFIVHLIELWIHHYYQRDMSMKNDKFDYIFITIHVEREHR